MSSHIMFRWLGEDIRNWGLAMAVLNNRRFLWLYLDADPRGLSSSRTRMVIGNDWCEVKCQTIGEATLLLAKRITMWTNLM